MLNRIKLEKNGNLTVESIREIKTKRLSVKYTAGNVIKNLDLSFRRGNIYVIRGDNGSGKTTLINTILGVLNATEGEIYYNEHQISSIDMYSVRKKLYAVTTQEPYIYSGTLSENITYGSNKSYTQEVSPTIISEFLSFFDKQEKKENTYITSKNTALSGGEKQKISICRALLKNSDVLIFDEPTNALDAESIDLFFSYLNAIS